MDKGGRPQNSVWEPITMDKGGRLQNSVWEPIVALAVKLLSCSASYVNMERIVFKF